MQEVYQVKPEIDFDMLRVNLRHVPYDKVFYYDSLDTEGTDLKDNERLFDEIRSLDGFHVHLGSVSGTKGKKRQKQVDVRLAVEMMMHAYQKNMSEAGLLAGDLDFKPLVENLIRLGTFVYLHYAEASTSKNLVYAADAGKPINLFHLHRFLKEAFKKEHPLPQSRGGVARENVARVVKRGKWNDCDVTLNQMKTGYVTKKGKSYVILALKPGQPDHTAEKAYYHHDSEELERFFRVV